MTADREEDFAMEAARRWFVLMREADAVRPEEQAAFAEWLRADPRHAAALQRVQLLWERLDSALPELQQRQQPAAGISRRDWLRRAAGVAIMAGGASYAFGYYFPFADLRTAVGERRQVQLPDGSRLEMGGDTAVSLDFNTRLRHVDLHGGEAFFTVQPDAARPFVVRAASGDIEAMGTAFNVKSSNAAATVSVVEHGVVVRLRPDREIRLRQGQQLRYAGSQPGAVQQVDPLAVQAWRQGRLFFLDTPLADALADLERYRPGAIVILDSSLAALPVTGIFHAEKADEALHSIAGILKLQLTSITNRLTIVRRA